MDPTDEILDIIHEGGPDTLSRIAEIVCGCEKQTQTLTDEQIDRIAENCAKSMPDGIRGFCRLWGWRQFARELLDVCTGHERQTLTDESMRKAVEFAEYMAKGAEQLLGALNAFEAAKETAVGSQLVDDINACDVAAETLYESVSGLRSDIYEFRKRAERIESKVRAGTLTGPAQMPTSAGERGQ